MISKSLAAAGALLLVSVAAQAQTPASAPALTFEQAVFITCKEAHAMRPEVRKALAYFLAEYSARYRGVTLPEDSRGSQVGYLVRGGCTLAPDAYLFTVIDRAIIAEASKLPKR
jgi:hypothetical protein